MKSNQLKKVFGLALAVAASGLMVTGVAAEEKVDIADVSIEGDPYKITMAYLTPGPAADDEEVHAAIAELALKEQNVDLTLIPLSWGDKDQKLQLMLSSGDDLDIFVNNNQNGTMNTYIQSGFLTDLTPYIDSMTNAQEWAGDAIPAANIGGFQWGIQAIQERCTPEGLLMRKDILNELGYQAEDITSVEVVEEILGKVKEAYPNMDVINGPWNGTPCAHALDVDTLGNWFGVLDDYGKDLTVVNKYETALWTQWAHTLHDWYQAGYISKDMETFTDSPEAYMKAGNTFAYFTNQKPDTVAEKLSQTGYELVPFLCSEPLFYSAQVGALGFMISSYTEDPARTAKFLDWWYGNAEANDLLNFGIEGKHWVEGEDGLAHFPEGVTADSAGYHHDWGWCIPNQFIGHLWEGKDADLWEQYQEVNRTAYVSKAFGFNFDSEPVTDQIIACQSVYDQYIPALASGAAEDVDAAIENLNNALYNAGLQDIIDEKQSQLLAWAEENGVE